MVGSRGDMQYVIVEKAIVCYAKTYASISRAKRRLEVQHNKTKHIKKKKFIVGCYITEVKNGLPTFITLQ